MSRKVHVIKRKKIYVKSGSKKTWYYFRISLISLFMGFAVYTGGRYFFPLSAPCANSLTCQSDLTEKIENGATGMFQGQKVIPPIISLAIDESGLGKSISMLIWQHRLYTPIRMIPKFYRHISLLEDGGKLLLEISIFGLN